MMPNSPASDNLKMARTLRAYRERRGLSLWETAQQLKWPVSRLNKLESGNLRISVFDTARLLRLYNEQRQELLPAYDAPRLLSENDNRALRQFYEAAGVKEDAWVRFASRESVRPEFAHYYGDWIWTEKQTDWIKSLLLFFDGIALALPQSMASRLVDTDPILAQPLAQLDLLRNYPPSFWLRSPFEADRRISQHFRRAVFKILEYPDADLGDLLYSDAAGFPSLL
jgi:transcriptional regulator with XRE-family HTH domain